jgi:probable rRNA maturation factor
MIAINNLTKTAVSEVFLKRIAKIVLEGEKEERKEISIILIGRKRIKSLNKRYRDKDKETDVLSFKWDKNFPSTPEDKLYLGEIAICQAIVKKNAVKNNSKFKEELAGVLTHGILHLIGYEHEKGGKAADLMQDKETYYASKI